MKINAVINSEKRALDGLADIHVLHENGQDYQLDLPFRDLYQRCGVPSLRALDLLVTASVCYVVDKTVMRSSAENGWTRELEVSVPVSEPKAWSKVAGELAETLSFLTGDEWTMSFRKAEGELFEPPKGKPLPLQVDSGLKTVCLFSGGLDSLGGAIDLLSDAKNGKVLLIGHYDGAGPRSVQVRLAAELEKAYPNHFAVEHIRVAHRPAEAAEETLRSRSLVFIALGLYGAQAAGPNTPLYMFENGFIALNVPLTPSRRGSCSTRTMHPYFLYRLRAIIAALGITNPIINPYGLKTKGECVAECKNKLLLARLADISVSCSHSSRHQYWVRTTAKNCGYCVPCICRRAALFKAGLDNGQDYGRDIIAGELTVEDQMESANDLRAVTDFLNSSPTEADLRKKILAVARFPDLDAHAQLALRGIAELKRFLNSKAAKVASRKHA
jgi:7-cyano-7-deazaguanine synthase in queuosine biosynthesis